MLLKCGWFCQKYQQKRPHSLPVAARYGVFFVDLAFDWYSTSDPAITNAISYYIGPLYNGTQLYVLELFEIYGYSSVNFLPNLSSLFTYVYWYPMILMTNTCMTSFMILSSSGHCTHDNDGLIKCILVLFKGQLSYHLEKDSHILEVLS